MYCIQIKSLFWQPERIQGMLNQVMDSGLSEATLQRLVQSEQRFSTSLYTHHSLLAKLRYHTDHLIRET